MTIHCGPGPTLEQAAGPWGIDVVRRFVDDLRIDQGQIELRKLIFGPSDSSGTQEAPQ